MRGEGYLSCGMGMRMRMRTRNVECGIPSQTALGKRGTRKRGHERKKGGKAKLSILFQIQKFLFTTRPKKH